MVGAAGAYAGTHTADTGGAPTNIILSDGGSLNGAGLLYGTGYYKFAAAVPASADYSVSANQANYQQANEYSGVLGRVQTDTKHYRFRHNQLADQWELHYWDGGSFNLLGTPYAQTL